MQAGRQLNTCTDRQTATKHYPTLLFFNSRDSPLLFSIPPLTLFAHLLVCLFVFPRMHSLLAVLIPSLSLSLISFCDVISLPPGHLGFSRSFMLSHPQTDNAALTEAGLVSLSLSQLKVGYATRNACEFALFHPPRDEGQISSLYHHSTCDTAHPRNPPCFNSFHQNKARGPRSHICISPRAYTCVRVGVCVRHSCIHNCP